jgi:hypothetical protein
VAGENNFARRLPDVLIRGWTTYTTRDGRLTQYKTLEMWTGNQYAPGSPDGLMTGDYLTTKGHLPEDDRLVLEDMGLEVELGEGAKDHRSLAPPI